MAIVRSFAIVTLTPICKRYYWTYHAECSSHFSSLRRIEFVDSPTCIWAWESTHIHSSRCCYGWRHKWVRAFQLYSCRMMRDIYKPIENASNAAHTYQVSLLFAPILFVWKLEENRRASRAVFRIIFGWHDVMMFVLSAFPTLFRHCSCSALSLSEESIVDLPRLVALASRSPDFISFIQ